MEAGLAKLPLTPPSPLWGTAADQSLHVVLVSPEIPPNTGTIARLCAATGAHLHLVEPLGFQLDDSQLKRAGLDYWPNVGLTLHQDFAQVEAIFARTKLHLFSTHARQCYAECAYQPGDVLVFGRETKGLDSELRLRFEDRLRWIPIRRTGVRSINLACAVSCALYEAWRQCDFAGAAD